MGPHQPIPSLAHRDRSVLVWRERHRPWFLPPPLPCTWVLLGPCTWVPLPLETLRLDVSCKLHRLDVEGIRARPSATAPRPGCSATLEVGSNWFEVSWLDNFNVVPFHSILHWSNFFISCVLIPSLILLGLERRRVWIRMMNSISENHMTRYCYSSIPHHKFVNQEHQ